MGNVEKIQSLPLWTDTVNPQPLKGGLSNESFTVEDGGKKYVVRFGEDFVVHHVSRENEIMVSKAAAAAGFAPQVVHTQPGVMVVEFIEGRTYGGEDVCANIAGIAGLAKRFHTEMPRHVSGAARLFHVFHVIRDYARTLKAGNSRMVSALADYLKLSEELEAVQPPLPIIFAHNDLLPANFIDDGEKIWLIDFEYASYSTPMFDLAGIASNALMTPAQDRELLEIYFESKPDDALLRAHAAMKCASLLREAMWSMVSELHLDAPGVDYVAYTDENLGHLETVLETYRGQY